MLFARIICILFFLTPLLSSAQEVPYNDDDITDLYAQTKQINQFIRRFNGEEDVKGNRYYPGDESFRNSILREKYLNILFDLENDKISQNDKLLFKNVVLNDEKPVYLSLENKSWWAEVKMVLTFNNRPCEGAVFLEIEEQNKGLKWSIRSVHIPAIMSMSKSSPPDTSLGFLHPLSHELDFMNFDRVFQNPEYIELFLTDDFKRDPLTIFTEYVKNGKLKFKAITDVRFHMFQIENWYFEIREFNRPGLNKGYLISKLNQVPESMKTIKISDLLNAKN